MLVVVVGVEAERTDDLATELVPDGEAVAVLDEPAVLVAGAPAAVLQRGFAYGARESGHLAPRRGVACRRQPGDEALLGGVAPVLGADAPACGHVVCERDIARGVDVARRGVH